ncbi:MAG TPA: sodium:solute symporter [Balneolales bacterium]|nr:sodium:solute symporter [Balneolales bacterium]
MLFHLHFLDLLAIVLYLAMTVIIGIKVGGKPTDTSAYFTTKGSVPWWAASFSIVATETSMLTVISAPTLAYFGSLVFLQIVVGYIIGRIIVSFVILPSYFTGNQKTAYTFFHDRFGPQFQRVISFVFLVTRLLADGVRLFAAAIPIKLITGFDYSTSILIIAVLTLAYTYYGGLKSVIWIDVLQLFVYVTGGLYIIFNLLPEMNTPVFHQLFTEGKLTVLQLPHSIGAVFTHPFNIIGAVIGGMFLTMASHGTDHLIVQRLLACPDLKSSRKALISSGFFVFIQFVLFLSIGLFLYVHYKGQSLAALGLHKVDEIFPHYILNDLPVGFTGFIIAGLFSAAMSTLSSSLSALSSSTMFDIFPKLAERKDSITISRIFMIVWTFIFIIFAISFTSTNSPVIEIGLGIAGFTYGALLGAFLIGRYTEFKTTETLTGLIACIFCMTILIIFGNIAWPWYTLFGVLIFLIVATVMHFLRIRFTLKTV